MCNDVEIKAKMPVQAIQNPDYGQYFYFSVVFRMKDH